MLFPSAKMIGRGGPDVDKVFATTLFTPPGANVKIPLPFTPDFVWEKIRNVSEFHALISPAQGDGRYLKSNSIDAGAVSPAGYSRVQPNGFFSTFDNASLRNVAWAFARAKKFFDVVVYTGDGVAGRQIPHGLSVKPGMIVVKATGLNADWPVYHASQGAGFCAFLNFTGRFISSNNWPSEPTGTTFTVGSDSTINQNGRQYVAYIFAHDPSSSGFIQCFQFTVDGNRQANVPLPWKAQWCIFKAVTTSEGWWMLDKRRGWQLGAVDKGVVASSAEAEFDVQFGHPNTNGIFFEALSAGQTYIGCAIREGRT